METKETTGRDDDALMGKVLMLPLCGCTVRGAGTLPDPVRIVFCAAHEAATPEAARKACGPGCGTVVGRQKTPMYCSEACCDAGRPLNPAATPDAKDGGGR